ncbi:tetratricopeptide repeat protein [Tunicatimonas pelagia]|uniref:tetratricopeptide repeat protein n=1 Tax=Tunicatimonas pelagia TaxID=931531 RepID=UPI002666BA77|nr:tetratricopeptide repeat protein [Tunicatimonas pelagia]WKN44673.1 tetratricopeptide repeat protein [Tunicatimonas pelagia]
MRTSLRATIAYLAAIQIISVACTSQEAYDIPEVPTFDEEYYSYALASVDEIIQDEPENADAYYHRAELLLQQNKANNALASIRKALEINGDEPAYHLASARALLLKGQNREAVRAAQLARSKGGERIDIYDILAEANINSNYFEEALHYSDSALRYAPKNPQNYFRKGKALVMLGDTLAAEQNLLKSLELGAEAVAVYGVLVDFYMNTGDYKRAKSYMEKILEQPKNATDSRLLLQQARILRKTGYEDSARVILYQIKTQTRTPVVLVLRELQNLYYKDRRYDSAAHYSRQLLAIQSDDKQAMLTLARVQNKRYNYSRAIEQYEAILELDSMQQYSIHQIATQELDDLRGKVAYLYRKKQEEEFQRMKQGVPSIQSITPDEPNP